MDIEELEEGEHAVAFNTNEHEIELPFSLSLHPTVVSQYPVGIEELEEEHAVAFNTNEHEFELSLSLPLQPTVLTEDVAGVEELERLQGQQSNVVSNSIMDSQDF